jgi:hypothetical protein
MTAHTVDGLMNVVHEAIGAAYDCGAYHRSPSFGMFQTKRDAALEGVRTYAAALAQSNAEAVLQELVACHFSVLEHPDPEEEARRSHARMGAAWKRALEVLGQIHRAGVLDVYGSAALAGQAPKVPAGWKLVEDFHVGDAVLFEGVEHTIFALGDRPGTFDIHQPKSPGTDRWRNVPPSALKYAASPKLSAEPAKEQK